MAGRKGKLVFGIGVNDVDYVAFSEVHGIKEVCPFYRSWYEMLRRCYSEVYQRKQPTYVGCSVCDDWIYLSRFKAWMETQDWQGKVLDKDLLIEGNKFYSPDTCVFVTQAVNNFMTDTRAKRGIYPIGVCFDKESGKFATYCRNPFTKKGQTVGRFHCPMEAHKAWQRRKHEHALKLADMQDDPRIAKALRERYSPDKDWSEK